MANSYLTVPIACGRAEGGDRQLETAQPGLWSVWLVPLSDSRWDREVEGIVNFEVKLIESSGAYVSKKMMHTRHLGANASG